MKKDNKKKKGTFKIQAKAVVDKGVIEEYFYMLPVAVTVRELMEAVHTVPEEAKEIWTELDLMEIVLSADSLIFENMMDTFNEAGDQAFLADKGIKVVYAVSYNTKDKEQVKVVLEELHSVYGGFMASDTEDLEPIFEVAEF
ncbi:MAG: hypothetical protein IKK59_07675 [Lachnospiraceae bacterium]|nr:hypothetical protein [Lachnospiraceae bacterium]